MAKFSILKSLSRGKSAPNAINFAGGVAFKQTAKLEFVSILLTTFLKEEFYRSEKQTIARIRQLVVDVNDPVFVAKAALYARNAFGMRSVSHLVAGELAKRVKGAPWTKHFYAKVARRPDDVMETLGYYLATYGRPIPNSLKKGLGTALAHFDEYQLAKYRLEHGEFKLVDAVNLVRPRATLALGKLMRGELAPAGTWETKLTQAGEESSLERVAEAKAEAWAELVQERKLGYLALLRNVRNILTHAPEVADELARQLAEEKSVRRSLVFPFQFLSAVEVLKQGNLRGAGRVMEALNDAIDHSLANIPKFEGRTLIALDSSGSMVGQPQAIGSLFAAALVKTIDADLMLFSDDARYVSLNRRDTTLTLAKSIPFISGGTNFNAIFQRASRGYDRIIILSDMQGWMGGGAPVEAFAAYQKRYDVAPCVYSFDLKGYGTLQFPQAGVYCLAGWSDRVFEIMQKLDRDPEALVREVESVLIED
jgi:hypothetical protein